MGSRSYLLGFLTSGGRNQQHHNGLKLRMKGISTDRSPQPVSTNSQHDSRIEGMKAVDKSDRCLFGQSPRGLEPMANAEATIIQSMVPVK